MGDTRLFLERKSYRRRRMMDAVRMLPLLCAVLFLVVPLMWPKEAQAAEALPLSTAIWYLFIVWIVAIVSSFGLWRRIRRSDTTANPEITSKPDTAPEA